MSADLSVIGVDSREVGFDGLHAELLGPGLVHEALVEIADFLRFRSRSVAGGRGGFVDDRSKARFALVSELIERAFSRRSGGISVLAIQPPLTWRKKSSCGRTDGSKPPWPAAARGGLGLAIVGD